MTTSSPCHKLLTPELIPDKRICSDCIEDTLSPFSRRFRYPFTACNRCGPRISMRVSPSDKSGQVTTECIKKMCDDCVAEFNDEQSRRYHFENNSCHVCGFKALLERSDERVICIESLSQLDNVDAATSLLQRGEIVAVKGIGGYFLACDSTNDKTVAKLRATKGGSQKPFGLMARDLEMISRYCVLTESDKQLLQSDASPLVILQRQAPVPETSALKAISNLVAADQFNIAFMLPDSALTHLFLKRMNRPIVITSGNLHGQIPCISNEDAKASLRTIASHFLSHDQPVSNSLESSVFKAMETKDDPLTKDHLSIKIRFSRGFAPTSIALPTTFQENDEQKKSPSVIALGVDSGGSFSILTGGELITSHEFSNLKQEQQFTSFEQQLHLYQNEFEHTPHVLAQDLNLKMRSSSAKFKHCAKRNIWQDSEKIQQQHAQIAACMIDNNWQITDGPVLGVALGGLAMGDDETFWGGEFLLADYLSYNRFATFKPVQMFGDNYELTKPWLSTYAHIKAEMGWARYRMDFEDLELTKFLESQPLQEIDLGLRTSSNSSTLASSCTLLFDAVAAAMGFNRMTVSYLNESLFKLESIVDNTTLERETEELAYPFQVPRLNGKGIPYVEPLAMWQAVFGDLLLGTPPGIMSARFHKGLAKTITHIVKKLCTRDDERWLNNVALSGTIFQNRILLTQVSDRLIQAGFTVLNHRRLATGSASVSAGQAAIAAARRLINKPEI